MKSWSKFIHFHSRKCILKMAAILSQPQCVSTKPLSGSMLTYSCFCEVDPQEQISVFLSRKWRSNYLQNISHSVQVSVIYSGWNCQPWPSRSQNWMFVHSIFILSHSQQFPTSSSQNQVELGEWATGHFMHWFNSLWSGDAYGIIAGTDFASAGELSQHWFS